MNPLTLIRGLNPRFYFGIFLVLSLIFSGYKTVSWHNSKVLDVIHLEREKIRVELLDENLVLMQQVRNSEVILKDTIDANSIKTKKLIADSSTKYNELLDSLSNRTEDRRGSTCKNPDTQTTDVTTGNTGSELSRPDSRFLIREALRADQLRLHLKQCYLDYEEVRNALNNIK